MWNRAPFYIDQLCISPPYTVYADPEQKQAENQRISKLNASAYVGATHGILGIPPGGRGEWTMVELRISSASVPLACPMTLVMRVPCSDLDWDT